MLDGMSIQQIYRIRSQQGDKCRLRQHDVGEAEDQEVAKEVLVVMAVCLHQHWKIQLRMMLDGMSIQQFIEFDHNKETNIGYVNIKK